MNKSTEFDMMDKIMEINQMPEVVYDALTGAMYEVNAYGDRKFIGWS